MPSTPIVTIAGTNSERSRFADGLTDAGNFVIRAIDLAGGNFAVTTVFGTPHTSSFTSVSIGPSPSAAQKDLGDVVPARIEWIRYDADRTTLDFIR